MRKTILDISDAKEIFDQILHHWKYSNELISPNEVTVRGGYSRKDFLNETVEFDQLSASVESKVQYRDRASEQLNLYKENMRTTMQRFSFMARGTADNYDLLKSIPALPDARSNEEKFMAPAERIAVVWGQLNLESPIVLSDGTTLEAFVVGIQVLRQAFRTRNRAFEQERFARAIRRQKHQELINRAVQYRSTILGVYGEDSDVASKLPYLWAKQDRKRKLKVVHSATEPSASIISDIQSALVG
ncbi:MAG: hypothetical protein LW628_13860 [Fimbriimonadaceae bacterium]|nr:hypothetical protein [Fimbriimonadaceae bacterium]